MKIYAPEYYNKFKCIADNCKHSCCIGWEIDIDTETLTKYDNLTCEYANVIKDTIQKDDVSHFRLFENKRCPHLDDKGLCEIIKRIGEDHLCDICREHPRYYNYTNLGKEVGIGMSCEAACALILSSDNFDKIIEIGETKGEIFASEYDAIEDRDTIFRILKDEEMKIDFKVDMIYDYFDVFLYRYYFPDITSKLEYMENSHKELILSADTLFWNNELSDELTRILAYYVYRHCSEANDFDEFFVSLSFAIFCTGLISSISDKNSIHDIARIVSEEIEYSEENTELIKSSFYIEDDFFVEGV